LNTHFQKPGRRFTPLLCALCPLVAAAEIGPAATGMTGRANDALAVFFSPAAITRLDRPEAVVQAITVYTEAKFEVDEATFDGGSADNDNRFLVIPGAYYVHPLGERWRLGVSLNVPSGIGNNYGRSWSGRYLAEQSELAFVASSAVAAYKITDRFSLAAGPFVVYTNSETRARINNLDPAAGDGSVKLEEDGLAAGAMFADKKNKEDT
jgi:long-chain fatty acid transport protein